MDESSSGGSREASSTARKTTKLRRHNRGRQERVVRRESGDRSCCTPETDNPPVFAKKEAYRRGNDSATHFSPNAARRSYLTGPAVFSRLDPPKGTGVVWQGRVRDPRARVGVALDGPQGGAQGGGPALQPSGNAPDPAVAFSPALFRTFGLNFACLRLAKGRKSRYTPVFVPGCHGSGVSSSALSQNSRSANLFFAGAPGHGSEALCRKPSIRRNRRRGP